VATGLKTRICGGLVPCPRWEGPPARKRFSANAGIRCDWKRTGGPLLWWGCLRRARTELANCKARWRTTLRPALAPMGEPLPSRLWAELPAYAFLRSIPGIGPTVGAILLAEIGDIAWYTKFSQLRKLAGPDIVRVQSGHFAGQARISKCGRGLLRWALYHAAMGMARTTGGARLTGFKTKRSGDPYAGFKAIVELAAKQLRVVWGVWRSGTPYDPIWASGLCRQAR
jgi:transposase